MYQLKRIETCYEEISRRKHNDNWDKNQIITGFSLLYYIQFFLYFNITYSTIYSHRFGRTQPLMYSTSVFIIHP